MRENVIYDDIRTVVNIFSKSLITLFETRKKESRHQVVFFLSKLLPFSIRPDQYLAEDITLIHFVNNTKYSRSTKPQFLLIRVFINQICL